MTHRSHLLIVATAIAATATLALAGCSAGGSTADSVGKAPSHLSGTVSLWHYYTDREAKAVKSVVGDFEKLHPDVHVQIHSGQASDQVSKAISSGGDVDVVILGGGSDLGAMCGSGAFRDLGPYIKRDKVDLSQFLKVPLASSAFEGKQCSLPQLSDVYGLYYNIDELKAAGYTQPPKTLSELESMALKLTTYNADGSIKTLGFDPLMGFYENQVGPWSAVTGASWMDGGKSTIHKDPAWTDLMTWQKAFVDKIGYKKLKSFTAGLGDEWSANQAFQTGQVAMTMDGEWRAAFIQSQAPNLHYGTAPFPTGDNAADIYGGGLAMSTYVGIAKTSKNPNLAWALTKYLTTNTAALVTLTNKILNIPTTQASLNSPDLKLTKQFTTFLKIAQSSNVFTVPQVVTGTAPQTTLETYWESYQAGTGGDLAAGLKKVDTDINNAISLSSAG